MPLPSGRSCALVALIGATLATQACVRRVEADTFGSVLRDRSAADTIRFTYLGTGGWIIERGADMLMTGPLYTNPSFMRVGLASIRSDTSVVDAHMGRYDVSRTRAILVGHAHYDHLMDVPRVARRFATGARIVGSTTVRNTLGTWSGLMDRVDLVEEHAGDAQTVGRWMWYGPGLRVMPLRSHHAPHFEGMTLYRGTVDAPLSGEPRLAREWKDGHTFAFLVDFLDHDGAIAFRIYYQDAVTEPPSGFAPEALMDEHPVDVAVFVPATFDQVAWHPEAFVENLRPRRVLLGHWEDFFVPYDEERRSIRLSDIEHFEARLRRVFDGEWWRPAIGAEFAFGR